MFLLWAGPYSSPGRGVLTISLDPPALSECLVHLDALASLRHRPPALHRPDIVGRLALLFGQLGQAVAQARGEQHEEPGTAHPGVVQAMRLLEADLARDWTLTGLAAELHLAPGYLVRLFNAATGLPPMAYLAQLRAEHAAVLLLHSDEPVTSIGRTVGWPDQSNFARRFKAHYGLSATTYRKRFGSRATHLHLPAAAVSLRLAYHPELFCDRETAGRKELERPHRVPYGDAPGVSRNNQHFCYTSSEKGTVR